MYFDGTPSERKTKAVWEVESSSTPEKRQKILSPLKFSNIQKVSKKTLQQQRVTPPEVSITATTMTPVQSSLEVTLSSPGDKSISQTAGHVSVFLISVKEKMVSE